MGLFAAAAALWLAMAVLAVLNGMLREAVLIPSLGAGVARPLSAALLVAVVFALAWVLVRWKGPLDLGRALAVGAGWVAGTVIFEAVVGRLRGLSGAEIAAAYDPLAPTLWFWVVVAVLLAPMVVGRLLR